MVNFDTVEMLEWDESSDMTAVADGIGSLTVHERASGYMGPQSGTALLRYLHSVSNFLAKDGSDWARSPLPPPAQNVCALQGQLPSSAFQRQYLDWYFEYFHTAYPLLHEGCFRAQYMGMPIQDLDFAVR